MTLISSINISFLSKWGKRVLIFLGLILAQPLLIERGGSPAWSEENRIRSVVEKMTYTFDSLKSYACEVEQFFYQDGKEDQSYRFKFYYGRNGKIRVDFISPYSGMSIFYRGGEKEATVRPFRSLPTLKLKFSVHNPLLKTPAGQTLDQTDMGYFLHFLKKNLQTVKQTKSEYQEEGEKVIVLLFAKDYIRDKTLEQYRIHISKKLWLPIRIERYHLNGQPVEVTVIKAYELNDHLEEAFFIP